MSAHHDEKNDGAASDLTFHIRPVKPQDGEAVFDILQRGVQQLLDPTRDETSSLGKVQSMVTKASKAIPNILFLVAERSVPLSSGKARSEGPKAMQSPNHDLLGCAMLTPFARSLSQNHRPRSCYDRTASMVITLLHGASLDVEDHRRLTGALVREVLTLTKERGFQYKTIVSDFMFREDLQSTQGHIYALQEEGFRVAGMLEEVIEKDGVLSNIITLQGNV